jgi:hypothetical protein
MKVEAYGTLKENSLQHVAITLEMRRRLENSVKSKPKMKTRKPWCLLSDKGVGLWNPGEGGE